MDVLLSWSGEASHDVALFLRGWLKDVLPGCEPWVSSKDIPKGRRWRDELEALLGRAKSAVLVITPESVASPWLHFEAGWVASKLGDARLCTFLVGVEPRDLAGSPLADFQATRSTRADTLQLVRHLNAHLAVARDPTLLEGRFAGRWRQLRAKLARTCPTAASANDTAQVPVLAAEPAGPTLSDPARRILLTACAAGAVDPGGVLSVTTFEGLHVRAGGVTVLPHGSGTRDEARWRAAMDELRGLGLLTFGDACRVTDAGWKVHERMEG